MKKKQLMKKGFTLIEILVVIGLIAILATIVIIAMNPARQFAQGRNTQRTSNVQTILNAMGQKMADNKGIFEGGNPNCPTLASGVDLKIASGSGNADLTCLTPTYIPSGLPLDPRTGRFNSNTDYDTGYTVKIETSGRYTVTAPSTELDIPDISVTR